MIDKYVDALFEEEKAFSLYKSIFMKETEAEKCTMILSIMNDEYNHFKKLNEILFKDGKSLSDLESTFQEQIKEVECQMKEWLEKMK